jgi:hypothetical protein
MMFCPLLVILLLLILFKIQAISDATNLGVDDWTPKDIASFFSKCGCKVKVSSIESIGLAPSDLFDGSLTSEVMDTLDIPAAKHKKVLEEVAKLDAMITKNPGDIFEWRITNRKMFYWLQDLTLSCPRITLLWLRYAHNDKADALDLIDDLVDKISDTEFWFWWVFSPYTFFAKAADELVMEKSWADEFIKTYFNTLSFLGLFSWLYAGEMIKVFLNIFIKILPVVVPMTDSYSFTINITMKKWIQRAEYYQNNPQIGIPLYIINSFFLEICVSSFILIFGWCFLYNILPNWICDLHFYFLVYVGMPFLGYLHVDHIYRAGTALYLNLKNENRKNKDDSEAG